MDDRYATDVLAAGWRESHRRAMPRIEASVDLVVEVAADGFCGAVVGRRVRAGRTRGPAAAAPVVPSRARVSSSTGTMSCSIPPTSAAVRRPAARTASGSFAAPEARARVARASRILVEGRHDAELVEKVWGDDLRAEGVVVEYLQGIDLLAAALEDEPPSADRRYGVLVDHLVRGSKESRIADAIGRGPHGAVRPDRRTPVRRRVAVRPAARARHRAVAGRPARHRHQGRHLPRARVAVRDPGRPRPSLAADPRRRHDLSRPRSRAARPRRGADRLRRRLNPRKRVARRRGSLAWERVRVR